MDIEQQLNKKLEPYCKIMEIENKKRRKETRKKRK